MQSFWENYIFNFFFQELAEKEQLAQEYKEYPAVLIKEAEIKNIVKLIDDPSLLKSTVSCFTNKPL